MIPSNCPAIPVNIYRHKIGGLKNTLFICLFISEIYKILVIICVLKVFTERFDIDWMMFSVYFKCTVKFFCEFINEFIEILQ